MGGDASQQFETNSPLGSSHEAREQEAAAFVVSEAAIAGPGTTSIIVCKLRNHECGSTGTTRIPVLTSNAGHAVGEFIYAIRPAGGTEAIWAENTSRVEWVEIGGGGALPIGEFEGQLWGNISDNATGFKFPSLHAIPPEP